MKFRARLSLDWLETRDVPDGTIMDPPTMDTTTTSDPGSYSFTPGSDPLAPNDPSSGPISGGDTYAAPPPPTSP